MSDNQAATVNTTHDTDVHLQHQLAQALQENTVLLKQKERATKENESFRTQAVSQLKSLQKNLADKNKLIRDLKKNAHTFGTVAATTQNKPSLLDHMANNTGTAAATAATPATATTAATPATAATTIATQTKELAKSQSMITHLQEEVEKLVGELAVHEEREEELTLMLDGRVATAVLVDDDEEETPQTQATDTIAKMEEEIRQQHKKQIAYVEQIQTLEVQLKQHVKEKKKTQSSSSSLRELETARSDLARANAHIRQLEDDNKSSIKKHRTERNEWNGQLVKTKEKYQHVVKLQQRSKEQIELYRQQKEEFVVVQQQRTQETIGLKKQIVELTSEKSTLDLERCRVSEELTRERVLVETERRQRHELISKSEQDAVAKRQKLSRRVTKLTHELSESSQSVHALKQKNKELKVELIDLLKSTEMTEKNMLENEMLRAQEKKQQSNVVDDMLKAHQEHVEALRKTSDMKLKRLKEDHLTRHSTTSTTNTTDNKEEEQEGEKKNQGEENSGIEEVKAMRFKIKALEHTITGLEQSLEHLRKIHAARVSELIKRHKRTLESFTHQQDANPNSSNNSGISDNQETTRHNHHYHNNTPAKRMLLSGSPMTIDKFEASLVKLDPTTDSTTETTIMPTTPSAPRTSTQVILNHTHEPTSFTSSSSASSFSALPRSPSAYTRQLKMHHQTTLRELAHSRSNCERLNAERTSYVSQISSMDIQMKAMQELVQQLETARDTIKSHHQNEKKMMEKQMLRLIKGLKICRVELNERKKEVKKIKKNYTMYRKDQMNRGNSNGSHYRFNDSSSSSSSSNNNNSSADEKRRQNPYQTPNQTPRKGEEGEDVLNARGSSVLSARTHRMSHRHRTLPPGVQRTGGGHFGSSVKKKTSERRSAASLINDGSASPVKASSSSSSSSSTAMNGLTPKQKREGLKLRGLLEPMLITMVRAGSNVSCRVQCVQDH